MTKQNKGIGWREEIEFIKEEEKYGCGDPFVDRAIDKCEALIKKAIPQAKQEQIERDIEDIKKFAEVERMAGGDAVADVAERIVSYLEHRRFEMKALRSQQEEDKDI